MSRTPAFKGVIPPVSTIFSEDETFDEAGMAKLINHLIERGVDGLFFLGTGGEFSQLSIEERKEIAELAVKEVNGRVPVLIGTGSTSTRDVKELNAHAARIGADAAVVINPYYMKLSEENLYEHYSSIAKEAELPLLLYNFPALTGQDLSPSLILKLVKEYDSIVGIKETVDSIGHIREVISTVKEYKPEFCVFCGFEDLFLNTLSLGGDGIIAATGNFAPELSADLYKSFIKGDTKKALELNKTLTSLPFIYKLDAPFVNVIKEAITICGLDVSTAVLPPSRKLPDEKRETLKETLVRLKLVNQFQ
ncbi:dihydrodipicolinate synthase family protein [Jeotgalibacillus proteolyticus]|uniref:Dihydrodipicolinate synthase family protein n=1 Tax=Jeotgalibacillus proteolyticus TaxID=2082395 RepID=A0A2S5GAG9_9BACL|nr:dihydrodipicolinate synthase family protein [Jeotgalibacillus proteolyticus]PPA69904.1 dihydrodipicolinate synthase family protein [Jeotgalibacillus proteolyticus]